MDDYYDNLYVEDSYSGSLVPYYHNYGDPYPEIYEVTYEVVYGPAGPTGPVGPQGPRGQKGY